MIRIKGDKSSGKDKAKYLKGLREQKKHQDVERVTVTQSAAHQIPQLLQNKPVKRVNATQLVAKTSQDTEEKKNSLSSKVDPYANSVGGDNCIANSETEGNVATESVDQLPAGFFDNEVNCTSSTPSLTPAAAKVADDQLNALMNELDNIPADEDDAAGEDSDGLEEEAVQLAYQSKLARILHRVRKESEAESVAEKNCVPSTETRDVSLDSSEVWEEADTVLMHYTSSVSEDTSGTLGSSLTSSTQHDIAAEVCAVLSKKKRKRQADEISSRSVDYSYSDLMDWTAKSIR